jgi:alkylhydroperoxidase/carboxymuconolactone decarboxylase family protein YurZ
VQRLGHDWGYVWGREGLDKKTRSMLSLAMISILNRPHELRLHIAGALRNGVSRDEIREIFMQVAIYGGVPAGVDSFRAAKEVFAQLDGKTRSCELFRILAYVVVLNRAGVDASDTPIRTCSHTPD